MQKRLRGNPEKMFPKAVRSFQSGQLSETENLCRTILLHHPDHADTLNLMGMVRANAGDLNGAVDFIRSAIQKNSFNPTYHSSLGEILGAGGDLEGAKNAFNQALSFEPDNVGFLVNLGTAHLQLGAWSEAAKVLGRAAELAPKEASVFARLGVALHEIKDFAAAVEAYQQAVNLGLEDPQNYYNLATSLSRFEDLQPAIKAYEKAIQLDPNYQNAYRSLGNIYVKQANYADAVTTLSRAVDLNPEDLGALADLGSAFVGAENFEDAKTVYQHALKLKPDSVMQWADLAFANLCSGTAEQALEASDKGLEFKQNDTSCLAFKSTALNHLGRRDEASILLGLDRLIYQNQFDAPQGYASIEAFNEALFEHVKNHSSLNVSKLNRGLVAGQGTGELFEGELAPVLETFKAMILSSIEGYKKANPVDDNHPFLIGHPENTHINCWATVIQSSGFLDTHFHPPGWLSGVYYPRLPDAVDIHAETHEGWIEFGREYYRINSDDEPPLKVVKPNPGLMVLFPSYLGHRTLAFDSSEERMSVAFDILAIE